MLEYQTGTLVAILHKVLVYHHQPPWVPVLSRQYAPQEQPQSPKLILSPTIVVAPITWDLDADIAREMCGNQRAQAVPLGVLLSLTCLIVTAAPNYQVGNRIWLSTRHLRLRLPSKKTSLLGSLACFSFL